MKVHNKEYGLMLTVAAADEIAQLCPDHDISKLNNVLFSGGLPDRNRAAIGLICALSKGYESARAYEDPGYDQAPLTPEMLLSVSLLELFELRNEAVTAFNQDISPSVEIDDSKKNESPAAE